ncbi:hypothetical protein QBC46DRAFT_462211 [Diplogelasinospora grovesii]|uniref:Uncharacterized protein n=1 Tax=Diplogelasinospora grovesii TaxID=303347 RepID=A0AAN6RZ48_9PEZI|nr:hypothetical protein QBC46DRAFT_462211 [Diplogelasinospora grovesii]
MRIMKHFAEVLALSIGHKLDKEAEMLTIRSVREHYTTIDEEVKELMAPYIKNYLAKRLGLFKEIKQHTFLTISSYGRDSYEYRHKGSRVNASTLLNTHCYTSVRLQEVCGAKYRDIICLVGWKDRKPDIKMDFKREIYKGLNYKNGAAIKQNLGVLNNHYLYDLTTVNGASCYLGIKTRTDLTEDFRTVIIRRNPDLGQSLPPSMREELDIKNLTLKIERTANKEERNRLKAKRITIYKSHAKLKKEELKKYRGGRRTQFNRIRHMMPEHDRLTRKLFLRVQLRSPEGRSAMQDLINLHTNDSRERALKNEHSYAKFCYVPACSRWITSDAEGDVFKCDPVKFRRAVTYTGYCPFHLGDERVPASERIHSQYIRRQKKPSALPCPLTLKPQTGTKQPKLPDTLNESPGAKFIYISALDLNLTPSDLNVILEVATSSSSRSTPMSSQFNIDIRFSISLNKTILKTFTNSSSNSTPLSSLFNIDIAFLSMALPDISVPSPSTRNVFTFSASKEQPPYYTIPLKDILIINTSALEPVDGVMAEPLHHYKGMSHLTITSAAIEPEAVIAESLPGRLVSKDDHSKLAPCKTKITRIVIKSGNRKTGLTNHSEDNDRVPEENILDDMLIDDFKKRHRGLGYGVEVVRTRRAKGGKMEYRVRYLHRLSDSSSY